MSLNAVAKLPIAFIPGAILLTKGVIALSISPKSFCIESKLSILSSKTVFKSPKASSISPIPLSISGNSSLSVVNTDQSKPINLPAISSKLPNSVTASPILPFKPSKVSFTPSTSILILSTSPSTSVCMVLVASGMVATAGGIFLISSSIVPTAVVTVSICPVTSPKSSSISSVGILNDSPKSVND